MTTFYSVGLASNPDPDDKKCDTESEAIDVAHLMSLELGFHATVAIWADDDEPVWVFVLGEMFRRV